jgi:hypothetical protein
VLSAISVLIAVALVPANPQRVRADGGSSSHVDRPRTADFNGDGLSDLVIVESDDDVDDERDLGALHVLYGSRAGLTTEGHQRLINADFARSGDRRPSIRIGGTLAVGDFDGDEFSDLAIGDPAARVGSLSEAGAVGVVYGSPGGLDPTRTQRWTQASPGVVGRAERYDSFGWSLAAGDFGRGPQDDLAINVWSEGIGDIKESGAVNVLYGSSEGLSGEGSQMWFGDSPGVPGQREEFEQFGTALAAGRFSGGTYADLAIGIPSRRVNAADVAGAVLVLRGSAAGLTAWGSRLWTQNTSGVPGKAESGDAFGSPLTVGRFAGRSYDDLAVAAPEETIGGHEHAGAVNVLYGSPTGLTAVGSQIWHQGSPGVVGKVEGEDYWGAALTAANFGRDVRGRTYDDLVIGDPEESHSGISRVGVVHVLYGSARGLTSAGAQRLERGIDGLPDRPGQGVLFGEHLTAADFGRPSRHADLVVAGQVESDSEPNGSVQILHGGNDGVSTTDSQFLTADQLGGGNRGSQFGAGLAARS